MAQDYPWVVSWIDWDDKSDTLFFYDTKEQAHKALCKKMFEDIDGYVADLPEQFAKYLVEDEPYIKPECLVDYKVMRKIWDYLNKKQWEYRYQYTLEHAIPEEPDSKEEPRDARWRFALKQGDQEKKPDPEESTSEPSQKKHKSSSGDDAESVTEEPSTWQLCQ